MTVALRVIDAGTVTPLRSQALWHGIASAMAEGDDTVLSLCRPESPYVGLGYHRRLDELDLDVCGRERIRIVRRRIGGGPVWLDGDQLFFQLTMPASRAPQVVSRLYEQALAPALAAFRVLGFDARLADVNDIVVGARKVSGTGAGRIDEAVTVVGNVILRFPFERMAGVLALPSDEMRDEVLTQMRAHVAALCDLDGDGITIRDAGTALIDAYSSRLGPAFAGSLRPEEIRAIERWEWRMSTAAWLRGPDLPERASRTVKVRAGVHVTWAIEDDLCVVASVARDALTAVRVRPRASTAFEVGDAMPERARDVAELERALVGVSVGREPIARRLVDHGALGEQVGRALTTALGWRD